MSSSHKKKKSSSTKTPRKRYGRVKPVPLIPGVERKFYDNYATEKTVSSSIVTVGGVVNLNNDPEIISAPALGDGAQNRDGKRITITAILIEGNVFLPPATPPGTSFVSGRMPRIFVALVQDSQANGNHVGLSEVMFTNPSAHSQLNPNPFKNLHQGNRFTTHKVWHLDFNDQVPFSDTFNDTFRWTGLAKDFRCYLKMNVPVDFNANTDANVNAVVNNAFYIVSFTDQGAATGVLAPLISFNSRIRFVG